MKNSILFFLLIIPAFLFAQYPTTGNKARLGYQTTGDGLIWRGVAADTVLKPRVIAHAYFQLDTVNAVLRRYIATKGSWQLVGASETDSTVYATRYWTSSNFFPLEGGTLTGTGGAGFIGLPSQVTAPGTPASGLNIYAQGSGFNWKGTDGHERFFASTLTGGRTYTLPDINGTFALGTGTTDRSARWTGTNTLGAGSWSDNLTRLQAQVPVQFQSVTTAGLPTGVTGYTLYNSTIGGIGWYDGARWNYVPKSDRSAFTSTYIPFTNSSGQLAGSSNFTYNGTTTLSFAERNINLNYADATNLGVTGYSAYLILRMHRNGYIYGEAGANNMFYSTNGYHRFLTSAGTSAEIVSGGGGNYFFARNGVSTGYTPNQGIGTTGSIIGGSATLWGNNPNVLPANIMLSENGMYTGVPFLSVNHNLILQVAATNKAALPWPLQTQVQADAVTATQGGVQYEITANGIRWYNGTRKAYALESTFARGTATYVPFFDANGQITQSSALLFNGNLTRVTSSANFAGFQAINSSSGTSAVAANEWVNNGGFFMDIGITSSTYPAGLFGPSSGFIAAPTNGLGFNTQTAGGSFRIGFAGTERARFTNSGFFVGQTTGTESVDVADDVRIRDSLRIGTTPAHTAITGLLTRDATGWVGLGTIGTGLSYAAGVLSATGTADGNGIYTGSGILASHTTRARVPDDGNLFFSQTFNGGADSSFFYFVNATSGERYVGLGMTDTASTGGASLLFGNDGSGEMSFELQTIDAVNGNTQIRGVNGDLLLSSSAGDISLSTDVAAEVQVVGLVRAKQEAYYEITSTSSPQTFSNTYSDNFVNQGSTQASFTFLFPASPADGQILSITWGNAVSTLTLDGNGNTITGSAVTTAVAGTRRQFKYYASAATWIKIY